MSNDTTEASAGPIFDPSNEFIARERTGSRDHSGSDEWDASKTPPSRFQKRKGSVFATPPSRDGHVERNRDAVGDFHKAHSKRWSISKEAPQQEPRRKSSAGEHSA